MSVLFVFTFRFNLFVVRYLLTIAELGLNSYMRSSKNSSLNLSYQFKLKPDWDICNTSHDALKNYEQILRYHTMNFF